MKKQIFTSIQLMAISAFFTMVHAQERMQQRLTLIGDARETDNQQNSITGNVSNCISSGKTKVSYLDNNVNLQDMGLLRNRNIIITQVILSKLAFLPSLFEKPAFNLFENATKNVQHLFATNWCKGFRFICII